MTSSFYSKSAAALKEWAVQNFLSFFICFYTVPWRPLRDESEGQSWGWRRGLFGHDKGKITCREFSAESENIDKMLWQFIFPWLFISHQPLQASIRLQSTLLRNSLPGCVVHALHHFSSDAQPAAKRSHVSLYYISAVKVQKCLLQSFHSVVWAGLSDTVGTVNTERVCVCVCVRMCRL